MKNYRKLPFKKPCTYCGAVSNSVDHFIPQSYARSFATIMENPDWKQQLLPACMECNIMASDKLFFTIEEKREYVKTRLAKRYKKLLGSPEWSADEIADLSGKLKAHIRAMNEYREIVKSRLNWQGIEGDDGIDVPQRVLKFWLEYANDERT